MILIKEYQLKLSGDIPISISKYAQAWAILKQYKKLSLTLETPRIEKTIRAAIRSQKKLDPSRELLERIQVKKEIIEGKLVLHFSLIPSVRRRDEFFDFDEMDDSIDTDELI